MEGCSPFLLLLLPPLSPPRSGLDPPPPGASEAFSPTEDRPARCYSEKLISLPA